MTVMLEPSTDLTSTPNNCGSGLAREEVGTFNRRVDWQTAFASKLAPTGIVAMPSTYAGARVIGINR